MNMPDDKASIQQRMHEGYASNVQRPKIAEKTVQAKQDDKRRAQHFQVRLDKQLAEQLQHYAEQRHQGVINAALQTIISKFFNGK